MPPSWLKHLSPRSSSDKDVKKPNQYAYPTFPPPPPQELLSNGSHWKKVFSAREHLVPSNAPTDTPLYALYRMYEHLMLDNTSGLRVELHRFWFNPWAVTSIPDPYDDEEPQRYAVLASLPALMVLSFNQRISLGMRRDTASDGPLGEFGNGRREENSDWESVPEWVGRVRPIETVLKIPHEEGKTLDDFNDPRASQELAEKNILCWQPHIHFL